MGEQPPQVLACHQSQMQMYQDDLSGDDAAEGRALTRDWGTRKDVIGVKPEKTIEKYGTYLQNAKFTYFISVYLNTMILSNWDSGCIVV